MVVLAIAGGGTKAAGWVRQRKWAKIIAIPAIIIVLLFAVITFTGGW